jgi:hypothetical protein
MILDFLTHGLLGPEGIWDHGCLADENPDVMIELTEVQRLRYSPFAAVLG